MQLIVDIPADIAPEGATRVFSAILEAMEPGASRHCTYFAKHVEGWAYRHHRLGIQVVELHETVLQPCPRFDPGPQA